MGDESISILIFGFGAIGGFFAFILSRNPNVSLSVIARSNYDAVKNEGVKIKSANHGEHTVEIDNVYKSLSDVTQKFDYIICCHKAINTNSFPPLFKDIADEDTTFVIIQNGAGNEEPFRKEYPDCTIISIVTWIAVTQTSPGLIEHKPIEETHLGLFPNPKVDPSLEQNRLDRFAELLKVGRTPFEVHDDVQVPRWEKMIWNAVWNFTSMITGADSRQWRESSEEAPPITKRLMQEMADIGIQCGIQLDPNLVEKWYDKMVAIGGVHGSTYVDMKEGKPMETEIILGTPLRKARELNIDAPVLQTVYALSRAIDGRIQQQI